MRKVFSCARPLCRVSAAFTMALVSMTGSRVSAQTPSGPTSCCSFSNPPPIPCCIGEWSDPVDLGISCDSPGSQVGYGDCTPDSNCVGPRYWDEIAHAVLLPTGSWEDPDDPTQEISLAGKILVWTTCDDWNDASMANSYRTYIIDPDDLFAGATFGPPILMRDNGPLPDSSGIFCSGHTWILDENRDPKLLVVGGVEYGAGCEDIPEFGGPGGMPCALKKAFWFDPLVTDTPPPSAPEKAWSDDPDDLPERNWYPSVITFFDDNNTPALPSDDRFLPIAFGGSGVRPPRAHACGSTGETVLGEDLQYQYDHWWYIDRATDTWTNAGTDPGYLWQQYPRTVLLSDERILSFGSAIVCETGTGPGTSPSTNQKAIDQYGSQASYGGNPVHRIVSTPTGMRDSPLDPNFPAVTAGGWNYANVVLLHTLVNESLYQMNESNYYLDRVIIHGGSQDAIADQDPPDSENALALVKEWRRDPMDPMGPGELVSKASAPLARIFGNLVILPDGSLLAGGGQQQADAGVQADYLKETSRYWPSDDPAAPGGGVWEAMADRRPLPTSPFMPRGYHSVALLLQDGSVALMGGRYEKDDDRYEDADSLDTVEIYKPPYMFEVQRLKITGTLGDMTYGTEFTFSVNKPGRVAYACLIGIGSVTHHFDYGQRYVELMATPVAGDVKVWVPATEGMLPEGFYLLFVVEKRAKAGGGFVRIPSKGRFVKVTF